MRKIFTMFAGAIVGVMMMPSTASAQSACGEVTMTDMNWASSQVVTGVAKFIMEQGYGCKVTMIPSATVTAVASMSETNKPDIATEIWVNSAALYPKLEKAGKVVTLTNVLSDGGEENWWIPKYLADKYPELKTVADVLKNPAIVGGKFHNCPVGWGCRIANDHLVRPLDLKKRAWKFSITVPVKHWQHQSHLLLPTRNHGLAIIGHQRRSLASIRWSKSTWVHTTPKFTNAIRKKIVTIRKNPLGHGGHNNFCRTRARNC